MNAIERVILKAKRQVLREENAKYPARMTSVPESKWPEAIAGMTTKVLAVWRSNRYLAVFYQEPGQIVRRLSICRASIGPDGRWAEGLTWDELQQIKNECGFYDSDAVEIYPAARDVVNVANMRHLWILWEPCEFAWRKSTSRAEDRWE